MRVADLFCGAGGTSIGAHLAGGVNISFAVNHWDLAIRTHRANFPKAKHVEQSLKWVHPSEAPKIDLLFASPECTHHSKARGGRPTSNQQRAGAWELMPWIEHHRPSYIVVENVTEFRDWGPVSTRTGKPLKRGKGKFFDSWIKAIESAQYRVDFHNLNAADFGAATSRNRLFIIARKGNRSPWFPERTHSQDGEHRQPWRGAIEIIDWSIPMPSVFARKRPLADKTLARIEKGLDRHVAPMIVTLRNNAGAEDPSKPLGTMTAGGRHHGVTLPFVTKYNGDPSGGDARNHATGEPLRTLDTSNRFGVVAPFIATVNHGDSGGSRTRGADQQLPTITTTRGDAIACPFFVPRHGERAGQQPRSHGAEKPYPTIATSNSPSVAVPLIIAPQGGAVMKDTGEPVPTITTAAGSIIAVPFVTTFYGTMQAGGAGPLPTVTTVDRHAATLAALGVPELPEPRSDGERKLQAKMKALGVLEIGFRMLSNPELANAQGFPLDYEFCGTKKDVTKQIGNSVSPPVAQAITEAILGGS